MLDAKQIKNFEKRINKANRSFSVGGDMLLVMQMEVMPFEDLVQLQKALIQNDTKYPPLAAIIQRRANNK